MNDRGVVIVGAGECGTRAAFALREEGYAGPVTLIGAERHLPYERPPLSKEGMVGTATGMKVIADAGRLQAAGIRLIPATQVVVIDRAARRVELSAGGSLPYEKLLLATGAQPRRLPLAENSRHCAYTSERMTTPKPSQTVFARRQASSLSAAVS
jgi:3-phenylpropionate/trans-cinnamate dioxygenase ferredoxin reductase subunit